MAERRSEWEWDEDYRRHKCYSWTREKWIYGDYQPPTASNSQSTSSYEWELDSGSRQFKRYSWGQEIWICCDAYPSASGTSTTPASAYYPSSGYIASPGSSSAADASTFQYTSIASAQQHQEQTSQPNYSWSTYNQSTPVDSGSFGHTGTGKAAVRDESRTIEQTEKDRDLINKYNNTLHTNFKLQPQKFEYGLVFKILWIEPSGAKNPDNKHLFRHPKFKDEIFYTKVKWFLVISDFERSCICLPINTYNKQGVAKSKIVKSHHAIIFTGHDPGPTKSEAPVGAEQGMRRSIKVRPLNRRDRMDPMSRLDYSRPTTVEKNTKISIFGYLYEGYEETLDWHAADVQKRTPSVGESSASAVPRYIQAAAEPEELIPGESSAALASTPVSSTTYGSMVEGVSSLNVREPDPESEQEQ